MQTLTVFAKADPKLFIPEQLTLLQPYVENLTSDDLHLFRSVIVIYRYSLCILTNRHTGFLQGMQSSLLRNLTRLPSLELREVVSCLWTISGILNSKERLIRVTISCLSNIRKAEGSPITSGVEIKRMARTIYILGLFGHFCDFEDQLNLFKGSFPTWSGNSVAGFITDTIVPFCSSDIESSVRKAAIESLGHVCQSYAVHFIKPRVLEIFDRVFEEKDIDLIKLVLGGFKGFLLLEESRSERERENENTHKKGEKVEEPGRLTQAAYANLNDGVSTSLSQKYLKNIISIAIQSQDGYALIATEVIASILRQGLVHPKEVCDLHFVSC
jgi:cohesin loading factor subunit SCC2